MRTPRIAQSARVLLAAAAVVAAALVPTGAASAATQAPIRMAGTTNCGTIVGGFDAYVLVRSAKAGGRTIQLYTGKIFDEDHAYIKNGSGSDRVWIDKRKIGSATWTQCGPFNAVLSNEVSNHNGWQTRACFNYKSGNSRPTTCTTWYNGHD
ncbi:hypothetical protein [Kineosporia succinea]|uniref:Secreted protein n=1 Tax=Kineosporia succinea TaxID=84632 RepID=A0ABT9P7I4_9ACTN|nr:hypothetical protein [Kineosporia succinea]MDP9828511.1 hypothetical protein [Kineosporia succinea]